MARSASARSRTLRPNDVERIAAAIAPTTGYLAAGSVTISRDGGTTRVAIGETIAVPADGRVDRQWIGDRTGADRHLHPAPLTNDRTGARGALPFT